MTIDPNIAIAALKADMDLRFASLGRYLPVAVASILAAVKSAAATPGAPPVVDPFPADPTQAPLSPENSTIEMLNGAVVGRPYLVDSNAAVWTLSIVGGLGVAHVGNTLVKGGGAADGISQLLVRQGQVWCILSGGQTQFWNPAQGSLYNGSMPPPWATPGGGTTGPALPGLPGLPTPSTVAPGSSGKIITCGAGQALATLSAAIPTAVAGDTIRLAPGAYTDAPPAWTVPLKVDWSGASFDLAGKTDTLARGKGFLVPCADSIIICGTVTGVAMDQTEGQLTSAIRPDQGCGYLSISGLVAHGNQCAIGHGGFAIVIDVEDSDISGNGLAANAGALTHNLYVGQDCVRLTLTNVVSTNPVEAHAIKYRGPNLIVNGGTFASAPGKPFDLPNGCTVPFKITGATILKAATDADHGVMACGEEGATNGLAGGTINGGAIQADCPNPTILGPGGTITLTGVTKTGNPITASGGIVLA